MDKAKLKKALQDRFYDFDGDYKVSTSFRITELNSGMFKVLLIINGRPQIKIKDSYLRRLPYDIYAVDIHFIKHLTEYIEYVGDYFDCHVIFKSETHTRDFILVKK